MSVMRSMWPMVMMAAMIRAKRSVVVAMRAKVMLLQMRHMAVVAMPVKLLKYIAERSLLAVVKADV